jgi:hypothetical protein
MGDPRNNTGSRSLRPRPRRQRPPQARRRPQAPCPCPSPHRPHLAPLPHQRRPSHPHRQRDFRILHSCHERPVHTLVIDSPGPSTSSITRPLHSPPPSFAPANCTATSLCHAPLSMSAPSTARHPISAPRLGMKARAHRSRYARSISGRTARTCATYRQVDEGFRQRRRRRRLQEQAQGPVTLVVDVEGGCCAGNRRGIRKGSASWSDSGCDTGYRLYGRRRRNGRRDVRRRELDEGRRYPGRWWDWRSSRIPLQDEDVRHRLDTDSK